MLCFVERRSDKEREKGKIRRGFSFALYLLPFALCLLFSTYAYFPQSQEPPQPGDVTLDGKIDISDLIGFIQHLLGTPPLTGNALVAADVNGDGQANIQDLVMLIQILQGLLPPPPKPSIASISPAEGVQGETISAIIRGTRLGGATAVTFDGGGVTATIGVGATDASLPVSIRVDIGAAAGARAFKVTVPGGQIGSGNVTFTVKPAQTNITSISPAEGVQGATVQAVIRGTRLAGATAVTFDGGGITATIGAGGTDTSLPVQLRIDFAAAVGPRTFRVTTPAGQLSSGNVTFTVKPPAPIINGISPNTGARGETVTAIISGMNLQGATAVAFDGVGVTARILTELSPTPTNLPIEIAIADTNAALGRHTFTVITPGGTARSGESLAFTVTVPPPIITGITPARASQGSTVNAVITGQNLGGAKSAVDFSGSGVTARIGAGATDTSLPVTITIENTAATDARTFSVTTPDGIAGSQDITFTVTAATGQSMRIATPDPVVNEGQSASISAQVLDANGNVISGAPVSYAQPAGSEDIISVNPTTGQVTGRKRGFVTITATSGNLSTSVTVAVVKVEDGRDGTGGAGPGEIKTDLAGRIYQTDVTRHIIRRGSFNEPLTTYAGVNNQPGASDGPRESAQFNGPLGIGIDNREGGVYVADSANHIVRSIRPAGTVETIVGTAGRAGAQDGPLAQARFNGPLGVAVDFQGNLFVADTGNSTIRYVDLQGGLVRTVAGRAGSPGLADGNGANARFSNPQGMSIDATGRNVIVADTGNSAIRLVTPQGNVTTIGQVVSISKIDKLNQKREPLAMRGMIPFNSPQAVSVDGDGNIYIVERDRVRVLLLRTGQVVDLAQAGTFKDVKGVAIRGTEVFVFDNGVRTAGASAVKRATVEAPAVVRVAPGEVRIDTEATIIVEGRNFASDTAVLFNGLEIDRVVVESATRLRFVLPPQFSSGLGTLTVQHRGGIAQTSFFITPPPFDSLPTGAVTTVAGGSTFVGDGGLARNAVTSLPTGVAVGPGGALFIGEFGRLRHRNADTDIIVTIAGNGTTEFRGDGGRATAAGVVPLGLALDRAGNIYISDLNHRIRRVDGQTEIITTIAGTGDPGFGGDGGRATEALIASPNGIVLDRNGNLFFSDSGNNRVRRIDAQTGVITTVAGTGEPNFSGDGGRGIDATLNFPSGLAMDKSGNLYIADMNNHRIRRVDTGGRITTFAGAGIESGDPNDGVRADRARLVFPRGLTIDDSGNLFVTDSSVLNESNQIVASRVRRIDARTNIIVTVAGGGNPADGIGDGLPATQARIGIGASAAVDGAGNIIISDLLSNRVRIVDVNTGRIRTLAGTGEFGGFGAENDLATKASLFPFGLTLDPVGNIAVVDAVNNRVRQVAFTAQNKIITTIAGTGRSGLTGTFKGDGGPAVQAEFSLPLAAAYDAVGNLFIADTFNHRIRRVDAVTKIITTIAGNGEPGFSGDGGNAINARLNTPSGIVIDGGGNIYIADSANNRIRRVDATTKVITTVAGSSEIPGFGGDGGPATAAFLAFPQGVAIDKDGNLYIADVFNDRIRRVDKNGIITTVMGGAFSINEAKGEAIPPEQVPLALPRGVAVDGGNNLFVADTENGLVWRRDAQTGDARIVVGDGFEPDGFPAKDVFLDFPRSLAIDPAGNLFIADDTRLRVAKRLALPAAQPGIGPNPSPPRRSNDECVDAREISSVPFSDTTDTTSATTSPSDPVQSCSLFGTRGAKSVWYRFRATRNDVLIIDTLGSNYDTILSVHVGSCGALQEIACNDDANDNTFDSAVIIAVTQGTTYLIQVTDFDENGGVLKLNVNSASQASVEETSPSLTEFQPRGLFPSSHRAGNRRGHPRRR